MTRIASRTIQTFIALILFTLVTLGSGQAQARTGPGGPFGLGIILGDPSAITIKYHLDGRTAFDAGLSFNFGNWTLLYGDWLYHFPGAFGGNPPFLAQTTPYVGVGGMFVVAGNERKDRYWTDRNSGTVALGVRIPLGLEWRAPTIPLGVFLEVVPGLTIIPGTHGFVQGGIGVRYYF